MEKGEPHPGPCIVWRTDGRGDTIPAARPSQPGRLPWQTRSAEALTRAAKNAGLTLSARKQAFFVQGSDRPGAAAEVLRKLSSAGVNIRAANGAAAQGDFANAAKALGA